MRKLRIVLLVLAMSIIAAPRDGNAQSNPNYDNLIKTAVELLTNDKVDEAFAKALQATAVDPYRYEGWMYLGIAQYRQNDYVASRTSLQKALGLAPDDNREQVRGALDLATKAVNFQKNYQAAKAAFDEGLIAKAAALYTQAWEQSPARVEVGMEAAKLWVERLNNPAQAAPILTAIANSEDENAAGEAREMLQQLQGPLQQIYDEKLREGEQLVSQGQSEEALKSLWAAQQARPERGEAPMLSARIYAKRSDVPNVTKTLGRMLKAGPVAVESIFAYGEFAPLLNDQRFTTWLTDALGPDAVAAAAKHLEKLAREERERKLEEARKEEERRIREAKEAEERRIREAKEAEERRVRMERAQLREAMLFINEKVNNFATISTDMVDDKGKFFKHNQRKTTGVKITAVGECTISAQTVVDTTETSKRYGGHDEWSVDINLATIDPARVATSNDLLKQQPPQADIPVWTVNLHTLGDKQLITRSLTGYLINKGEQRPGARISDSVNSWSVTVTDEETANRLARAFALAAGKCGKKDRTGTF